MVTMTLYAGQQGRHRCREQTFGLCVKDSPTGEHGHANTLMFWPLEL